MPIWIGNASAKNGHLNSAISVSERSGIKSLFSPRSISPSIAAIRHPTIAPNAFQQIGPAWIPPTLAFLGERGIVCGMDNPPAPIWPAVWSAIAASFSALASSAIFLFHRRNLRESVRPTLNPINFRRNAREPDQFDSLMVGRFRNDGRGPAQFITITSNSLNRPGVEFAVFATAAHVPSMPAGQSEVVNFEIRFMWDLVDLLPPHNDRRAIRFSLWIDFADAQNNFYQTEYELVAINPVSMSGPIPGLVVIDGLKLTNSRTVVTTPFMRRMLAVVDRLPPWAVIRIRRLLGR
jgi:hypothetical protein